MGSHWTCCTPEEFPGIERSDLFTPEEWDTLYGDAKNLFNTTEHAFDNSIRGQLVEHVLLDAYKDTKRVFKGMPLACQRNQPNKDYVEWTCPATILGDLAEPGKDPRFDFRSQYRCTKLNLDPTTGQVAGALVKNLLTDEVLLIEAKKYVICAGAVLTPGILFNSGLTPKALVSFLMDTLTIA